MTVDSFLDTNVLVYAAAGRERDERKRDCALELVSRENFGLSAQVLQEFYVTVTHKIKVPMAPADAADWIEQFEAFPCLPVDSGLVKVAIEASVRWQLSYWDAAILAAAEAMGAKTLYSEDFTHDRVYGSVRVRDPFR